MNTRQALIWGVLLLAALAIYTVAVYPALPDRIPIHWNLRGEPDGWADKQVAVLMMPGAMLLMLALIPGLPMLSPRNFSMETFLPTYNQVMLIVMGLFGFIHVLMLQAALDNKLDVARAMMAGIYLMFALIGNTLGKTRRNFFFGIRTPWTLANDEVWIATHRLGGRVFVAGGLAGLLLTLLGLPFIYGMVLLIVVAFIPVIYSYIYYRRIDNS